jgi:hypothetical protein
MTTSSRGEFAPSERLGPGRGLLVETTEIAASRFGSEAHLAPGANANHEVPPAREHGLTEGTAKACVRDQDRRAARRHDGGEPGEKSSLDLPRAQVLERMSLLVDGQGAPAKRQRGDQACKLLPDLGPIDHDHGTAVAFQDLSREPTKELPSLSVQVLVPQQAIAALDGVLQQPGAEHRPPHRRQRQAAAAHQGQHTGHQNLKAVGVDRAPAVLTYSDNQTGNAHGRPSLLPTHNASSLGSLPGHRQVLLALFFRPLCRNRACPPTRSRPCGPSLRLELRETAGATSVGTCPGPQSLPLRHKMKADALCRSLAGRRAEPAGTHGLARRAAP